MRGFYFIECDVDGRGKRWRLARVEESAGMDGAYFFTTFIDDGDYHLEALDVFLENGSRIVGPFTVQQLLMCVQVAEYTADCEKHFLPQTIPGERPITAGCANGLARAASQFRACNPEWKRENFR